MPSSSIPRSTLGAPGSNTELGPPERMIPCGANCFTNARSVPFEAGRRTRAIVVRELLDAGSVGQGQALVMRIVMAGRAEVGNPGVGDAVFACAGGLAVQHAHQQDARVRHQEPPRLALQPESRRLD